MYLLADRTPAELVQAYIDAADECRYAHSRRAASAAGVARQDCIKAGVVPPRYNRRLGWIYPSCPSCERGIVLEKPWEIIKRAYAKQPNPISLHAYQMMIPLIDAFLTSHLCTCPATAPPCLACLAVATAAKQVTWPKIFPDWPPYAQAVAALAAAMSLAHTCAS